MMSPANYMLNLPQQSMNQGITQGIQLATLVEQNKAAKLQSEQNAQMRSDLAELAQISKPTVEDYSKIMTKYPSIADKLKTSYNMMKEGEKQTTISEISQLYSALDAGKNDLAKEILTNRLTAAENSGDDQQIAVAKSGLQILEMSPEAAKTTAGLMLSNALGEKDFTKYLKSMQEINKEKQLLPEEIKKVASEAKLNEAKINKTIVETKKAESEIKKTNNEAGKVAIDALKSKLELDKLRSGEIKLSTGAEKLLNDSVIASTNSANLAIQYENLANEIDNAVSTSGVAGAATEYKKKLFGDQDKITRLKQEYLRLKNTKVLSMLPPGAASDKDIEIAQQSFPDENSDPKFIASFMRGLSKLQKYDAKLNEAQADWVNSVGSLGKTMSDLNIMGQNVPKGTRFNEWISDLIKSPNVVEVQLTPKTVEEKPQQQTTTQSAIPSDDEINNLLQKYGGQR